jgi:hypothetical protein
MRYGRIQREEISIPDKIVQLRAYCSDHKEFSFRSLIESQVTRVNIIATFLALLELMKTGEIWAEQEGNDSDIILHTGKAEEVEIEIAPTDVIIETCKSSGAGGQHVNKTESAIRLIHKPTGIVVECQDERSQFKNKDKAFKLLRTKLYDMKQQEMDSKIASERKSQVGTGDRSERIRTYNYPQGRITDHRIGFTVYSLEAFLNGDIGQMLDKLATADAAEKLKGGE